MSNYQQFNEEKQKESGNQEIISLNNGGEIELQPSNKNPNPNARDYLTDPKIKKKKQMLSIQAQKYLAEAHNKKDIQIAMLKRIIFRIFLFFFFLVFLILGYIGVVLYLAFIKSQSIISLPNNLLLNVDTCMLTIYDDSNLDNNMRIEFNIPGNFDPWSNDVSTLTSEITKDETSGYDTYSFTLENVLAIESCQISLYVGTGNEFINNFEFNCINDASCVVVSYCQNLHITNLTKVTGYNLNLNVLSIKTAAIEFSTESGLAQFNHFSISQDSTISLSSGNIILQSVNSFVVDWTSGVPSYCISAPLLNNYNVTGCERVKINKYGESVDFEDSDGDDTDEKKDASHDDETDNNILHILHDASNTLLFEKTIHTKKVISNAKEKSTDRSNEKAHSLFNHFYESNKNDDSASNKIDSISYEETGDESIDKSDDGNDEDDEDDNDDEDDEDDSLPDSCWGRVGLCSSGKSSCDGSKSTTLPTLYITTGTGAIFANVIPEVGKAASNDNENLKSVIFEDGSVGWSVSTLLDLTDDYDDSQADTSFDPVFLVKIGSKEANSSLFQQWVISFAPAYAYVRPWWIGTYSLTILSTSSYEIQADLNPGFCPYTPGLTQINLYSVQNMLSETFLNESSGIFSFSYPSDADLPPFDIDYNTTNYGFRDVPANIGDEYWISITKDNSTYYEYVYEDLSQSSTTKVAVILSIILATLVGLYLVIAAVYIINAIYIDIIETVTSTSKYSKFDKKDDPGAFQPLMNTQKAKNLRDKLNKPDEKPTISYNPLQLFRQLFLLAPPMSAFVDYLCIYMSKKYINSAEVFLNLLFVPRQNEDEDSELHLLEKERISGTEMKTLYEKFCYLHGYLEKKLDDENIVNLMELTYGFKIVTKNDLQTYTNVILLDDEIPKIGNKDRHLSSMTLFIQMCCKKSKFECDSVPVGDFICKYKEFCSINYLNVENIAIFEMSSMYGIGNSFLSQQWIVRNIRETKTNLPTDGRRDIAGENTYKNVGNSNPNDEDENTGFITKMRKTFFESKNSSKLYDINMKRLNNHLYLLMQLPEKIETLEELTEANKELILFPGWLVVDIFTVLFHIIIIFLLMVPVLGFFLLESVLYSSYSLSPDKKLITIDMLTNNIWGLPDLLYIAPPWIKILILIVLVFWLLGFIDLLYYYMKMEFPQDKFFLKTRASESGFFEILFRRLMWLLVIIALWAFSFYIALAMIWMILGAVINPTTFLPYAAGASTFVTVVTTKYNEFFNVADNGSKKVVDFIKFQTQSELNGMLKKMGLDDSGEEAGSDKVQAIIDQAVSLQLVDAASMDLKNQTDLATYAKDLKDKIKIKMHDFLKEKIEKLLKKEDQHLSENFIKVIISILNEDSVQLKDDLSELLLSLSGNSLLIMPQSLINLLMQFTFIQDSKMCSEDFLLYIIDPTANFIMEMLLSKNNFLDFNKDVLSNMIIMINSLSKGETSNVIVILQSMIEKVEFFRPLKEHSTLFKISLALFDGKINYHKYFKLLRDFMCQLNLESEIVDFFELFLNSFNHQNENHSVRDIMLIVERFVRKIMNISEDDRLDEKKFKEFKETISKIVYNLTMFFAFLYHEFDNIPKDIVLEIINLMKEKLPKYFPEEKYYKYFIPILQIAYGTIGCFLEEPESIIKQILTNASAFGISQKTAIEIKWISTIKYKQLYPGKEILHIKNLKIWKDICSSLTIDSRILMGLFGFITLRFEDVKEINDLIAFMLKLAKVDADQRNKTIDIIKLYVSNNENDISTSLTNLGIPKQFISLIFIAKRILDPKFVTNAEWIELGLNADADYELLHDRYTVFNNEKKFEKWRAEVAAKLFKVNNKIMEGNDDGPAKKTLLLLNCKGLILKDQIKDDLDTLSTNKNKIAEFTEYHFDLLTRLINSRTIQKDCSNGFDSDSQIGISELAKAMNLDENKLEQFLTLWLFKNSDDVIEVIKAFSPNFFESGSEENYEMYINYVYSKLANMTKKEAYIQTEFNEKFELNIPSTMLNKSIFNPNAQLDLNSVYEMITLPFIDLIQKDDIRGGNDYANFDKCLFSLVPIIKYLTSSIDVQDTTLVRKIFNIDYEGVADFLMILNETSSASSLSLFIDHVDKYCGESLKLFLALLIYFQGKGTDIEITNSNLEKISIKKYLSDFIYPELLDAMYAIFINDSLEYSEIMMKFFRRVEACKQKNSGSILLQSVVDIPSTIMENFLNLCDGKDYNIQIISKVLNLSIEAVTIGSGLSKIKNCDMKDKSEIIVSTCCNVNFKTGLAKIGVNSSEFLTILKVLYGCYDSEDIQWIVESLNLDKKNIGENVNVIKSLLALDQVLDTFETPEKNLIQIQNRVNIANQLLNQMNVDGDLILLASSLMHGDFSLIMSNFPLFNFLLPKYNDCLQNYQEFLMGLCGTISHRPQKISINTLLRQYYKNLQMIQDTDPDFMSPNSSKAYAIFCLYKTLNINPIWTFLYLGDINVWDYVWNLYYYNQNYKNPFLNPLLILIIVLNYIETPTPIKEMLVDYEYIQNYCNFLNDPSFQEIKVPNQISGKDPLKLEQNSTKINEDWNGYHKSGKEVITLFWNNWSKTKEKLEEIAKKNSYSSEVLKFWPDKDKNFTDQKIDEALKQAILIIIKKKNVSEDVNSFCIEALKSSLSLDNFMLHYEDFRIKNEISELMKNILPEIVSNIISEVSNILEIPKKEEEENDKKKKDPYSLPNIQNFFINKNINEFSMCGLSLITEIKNAFFGIQAHNDRGQDHYKLFTYKLDVLLSMIEKNTFHQYFMNSFSKYRVMQLVGLSAGFCIKGDDMIRANVTIQWNDFDFQKQNENMYNKYKNNQRKLKFFVTVAKLNKIWSILNDFKEARLNRYLRIYNYKALSEAYDDQNFSKIHNEPENIIFQSYPGKKLFKWTPFLFDVPTCNLLMDHIEENYYFGANIIASRLKAIESHFKDKENNRYDFRSGMELKELVKIQNKFNSMFQQEEFLHLVSIFKGYYKGLYESHKFFTSNYNEIVPYLYGLLGLNASAFDDNQINTPTCESYLAKCGTGLSSTRKTLAEIIKFLYGNAESVKKISFSFGDNDEIFENFMKLRASTIRNIPDLSSAHFLISNIKSLSTIEVDVFMKVIEISTGATYHLDEMVEFSKRKKNLTNDAGIVLSNLINNLNKYDLRSEKNLDMETFNLRDKTSFSINLRENYFSFYLELYKIAIFQFPDNVPANINLINIPNSDMFGEKGNNNDTTLDQVANLKNKDRLTLLFTICNNILDTDFAIFFLLNSPNFFDILKILNFGNNENDLKTLRVIISLKPKKLNPKFINNLLENLNIETRAKEFKELKIIWLPESLMKKEELEDKLGSLIYGMQYWNIVEILKGLEKNDEDNELYCLMQSFYIWKNLCIILSNWNDFNDKNKDSFIRTSLKIFVGKVLDSIGKIYHLKKNNILMKSPKKSIENSNIDFNSNIPVDQNYKNIQKELKLPQNKLNHAFVNQINNYKRKKATLNTNIYHYLDWMLSLSHIFPKNEVDPISQALSFFTGSYLKTLKSDVIMKYVINFSLSSYIYLFDKKKLKIEENKEEKEPEESDEVIGPLAIITSLPTSLYLFKIDDEQRKSNLMICDLFMKLCVMLQKKSKYDIKPPESTIIGALGVFKLVLKKMNFENLDLVFDIIKLLTGYDISQNLISNKKSPLLLETLFKVLQKEFLENILIRDYLDKDILTEMNKHLTILANFNITSLTDPKFASVVFDFLVTISGCKREPKQYKKAIKKKAVLVKKKTDEIILEDEEKEHRIPLLEALDISDVEAIIKLSQFDITYTEYFFSKLKQIDPQKIKLFHDIIEKVIQSNVYRKEIKNEETFILTKPKAGDDELDEILKKIQAGTATTHEVFVATDREGDSSGSICKQEFSSLAKRLNIDLTDHRINEIFASFKKSGTSTSDEDLNEEEFAKALQYLDNKNTNMTLESLGISKSMLIFPLISLIIILLLLFAFIFLGIQGFAIGSSFGSVINSLLPIGAGLGVGGQKDEEKENKTTDESVQEAVLKTKTIINSSKI